MISRCGSSPTSKGQRQRKGIVSGISPSPKQVKLVLWLSLKWGGAAYAATPFLLRRPYWLGPVLRGGPRRSQLCLRGTSKSSHTWSLRRSTV
ncbi:hypothetical protein ACOSQ2_031467 [Xanthoceras sorbifolium]